MVQDKSYGNTKTFVFGALITDRYLFWQIQNQQIMRTLTCELLDIPLQSSGSIYKLVIFWFLVC